MRDEQGCRHRPSSSLWSSTSSASRLTTTSTIKNISTQFTVGALLAPVANDDDLSDERKRGCHQLRELIVPVLLIPFPSHHHHQVQKLQITIQTIVRGLVYLCTFTFAANAAGLIGESSRSAAALSLLLPKDTYRFLGLPIQGTWGVMPSKSIASCPWHIGAVSISNHCNSSLHSTSLA